MKNLQDGTSGHWNVLWTVCYRLIMKASTFGRDRMTLLVSRSPPEAHISAPSPPFTRAWWNGSSAYVDTWVSGYLFTVEFLSEVHLGLLYVEAFRVTVMIWCLVLLQLNGSPDLQLRTCPRVLFGFFIQGKVSCERCTRQDWPYSTLICLMMFTVRLQDFQKQECF